MTKYTPLSDLASLANETSALTVINTNNSRVEAALDKTLSRDGSAPNSMGANLDMSSHRVINLAAPVDDNDAVRLVDLSEISQITFENLQEAIDAVAEIEDLRNETTANVELTTAAVEDAQAAAAEAASYIGAATSAPAWTTPRSLTWTGDVTGTMASVDGSENETTALTIANDAVTNAKLANVSTNTIKGRVTASTGDPEDLTVAQVTAMLNVFGGDSGSGGLKGLVPATAAGDAAAEKFLKASGVWATVPSSTPDLVDLDSSEKSLLSINGSVNLGPIIIKWGTHTTGTSAAGSTTVTFVDEFPNAILNTQLTPWSTLSSPGSQSSVPKIVSRNTAGIVVYNKDSNGGVAQTFDWYAIGY